MQNLPFKLKLLNIARWVKEHLLLWSFLAIVYSFTAAQLLEPLSGKMLGREVEVVQVWGWVWLTLAFPVLISLIPAPAPRFLGGLARLTRTKGLGRLVVLHELRSLRIWVAMGLSVLASHTLSRVMGDRVLAALVFTAQVPIHVALVRIESWRRIFALNGPERGAVHLMRSLLALSILIGLIFALVATLSLGLTTARGLALLSACFGAALGAVAVSLEGDSGRPFLVNLIALTTGSLMGFLCLWTPAFLPLGALFYFYQEGRAALRIKAVERVDEDVFFS